MSMPSVSTFSTCEAERGDAQYKGKVAEKLENGAPAGGPGIQFGYPQVHAAVPEFDVQVTEHQQHRNGQEEQEVGILKIHSLCLLFVLAGLTGNLLLVSGCYKADCLW